MARATRSAASAAAAAEKDKPADSPPTSRKGASKKRKRTSNTGNGDSPPTKHARTNSKDEGSPELEPKNEEKDIDLPSSGDVPILSSDAANILQVLELVDTQGLLDRVFPLPTDSGDAGSSGASSSSSTSMLSFRALLKNPSQYPLSVLCAAVKHLHPISSHPRSRPSEPAAQQLRFCSLATSLLEQASRNNIPVSLQGASLIPDGETVDLEDATALSQASTSGLRPRKYALVQHLPTGDWWSSASSTSPAAGGQDDLQGLSTGKADLVAIFPSTSGLDAVPKGTLGDYVTKRPPGAAHYRPPPPRRVSCGKFLYYGPYASFAPCFDQDGVEIGRTAMGEVIFDQEMKRRLRALAKGKRRAFLGAAEGRTEDVPMEDTTGESSAGPSDVATSLVKGIESLLPAEEVEAIKASLGTLEMEQAVDELLQKNANALQRLEELQHSRWREQGEGSSIVEVGSEEWDVAQGIIDSLALLASLRPRRSNSDSDESPIVPPPSVLRKLQRTLPIDATAGWYGTLPEGRTAAFRDDTTVHVRAGATKSAAATAATTPATPTPKATAPATTTPAPAAYSPYPYAGAYQGSQYRGGYGTYTPTQGSSSYYPNYTTTAPGQTGASAHYPNAQYTASGQAGYTYSPWYGYQNQAGATAASGHATSQPAATGYSGYYPASGQQQQQPQQQQQQQPQRAVANTVAAKPPPPATWNGAAAAAGSGGYVAPTLPPHMRAAVGPGAPGTPPPAASGYAGYYGGYQAPR
ncbi:hypothetical protein C8Q78DRAFT_1060797 [Trametes maxima]|nr:hypothetical protein C8Q78DRAFT_1060797 [Trametes maxima]